MPKERSRLINNASFDHAVELFKALFDEAIKDKTLPPIKITSGELRADFYEQLTEDAKNALEKGVKIQLVILKPDTNIEDNQFVNMLRAHENGEVYKAINEVKSPHFILVGTDRFRLETSHKQTKAVACFENSKIGGILNNQFVATITDTVNMRQLTAA